MAVARGDEGSSNVTNTPTTSTSGTASAVRRRMIRKPAPVGAPGEVAPAPASASPPIHTPTPPSPLSPAHANATRLDDLYRLPMPKLFAFAEKEGIHEHTGMNRSQLIMSVVRKQIERGLIVRGSGTLEVLPDGYGFLRSSAHNYLASPEDIYVSPSQIRRVGLKTGLVVEGPIRLPVEGQDNFALMQVDLVNGMNPEERISPTTFEDLTPLHPNRRLILETSGEELNMRVVDMVTPIGKGQRGLIVSPPRAGKTILLQNIGPSLLKNQPERYLIALLIDAR